MSETEKKRDTDILREFFKTWPIFYYFIAMVFGPMWFVGLSPLGFLKTYKRDGLKINLGSGPKKIADGVINIDGYPYPGVDIVADITKLPTESNSVGMIICDNVLEHVVNPEVAVSEMRRILNDGGVGYISTPFLYPFHSSPSDYHRWTEQGLRNLFKDFTMREIGVRCGMMSGLSIWVCYGFARLFSFGSVRLYWFLVNIALLLFFPIKFLDIIMNVFPGGMHTASVLYCVIEKRK